jgi:methyltransferase
MLSRGAVEYGESSYKFAVLMHTLFFVSLICENLLLQTELNKFWIYFLIAFLVAQFLRYWSIVSLGVHWNTKVLVIPGDKLVIKGPYKFISHPNYLAVIIELVVIPLIFSCYITAAVFSILNIVFLRDRIRIENEALKTLYK